MSAKNIGATADDYAKFDADKAKAGKPQPKIVTLQVWNSEQILPSMGKVRGGVWEPSEQSVFVWICLDNFGWREGRLTRRDGLAAWEFNGVVRKPIYGTRWCHIPKLQEVML